VVFNSLIFNEAIITGWHQFLKAFCCRFLESGGNVAISIKSYLNTGMTLPFLNYLRVYLLLQAWTVACICKYILFSTATGGGKSTGAEPTLNTLSEFLGPSHCTQWGIDPNMQELN